MRKANADWYNDEFRKAGLADSQIQTPYEVIGNRHIYNQYVIRCKDRGRLQAHLKESGIGCEIYYPVPLHIQKCFADLGYKAGDCPVSEEAARGTLAIPIYPELTSEQKTYVVKMVRSFYAH
jgi:dTDP-4-amino-4,6-dideoxygalactose transaminase